MVIKERYRYFGSGEIEIYNGPYFHKFGQELALSDPEAYDCVRTGGILRSEDFNSVGWSPAEKSDVRERKGPAFEARIKVALAKRAVLIDELAARLSAPPLEEKP